MGFFLTGFPTTYMSPEWNWSRCLLCCSRGPTVALHRPTWLSDVGTYPSLKKSKECVNMQHLAPQTRRTVNLNRTDLPYTCMLIPALQQPPGSLLLTSSISTEAYTWLTDRYPLALDSLQSYLWLWCINIEANSVFNINMSQNMVGITAAHLPVILFEMLNRREVLCRVANDSL